ncbi:hypothetical protein QJS10_CPA05g01371 [Acorus calamus]|uniref:Uncharacterized protein n=1 Tax=Acorus calamus TaxID=4465 RepID=A0AAV9ESS4_ACOCL|nr:hypothetical protein QJS10_CPA05g01371 [Acorus calamus]
MASGGDWRLIGGPDGKQRGKDEEGEIGGDGSGSGSVGGGRRSEQRRRPDHHVCDSVREEALLGRSAPPQPSLHLLLRRHQ